jgi:dimethylaniline monooxygenase (N-oxide forming)
MADAKNKVAIIGAGISGICSAKFAIEYGLEPTVFEKSDKPGGLWNTCMAWENLQLNSSKYSFLFYDFPWHDSQSLYPSVADTLEYLNRYIKHFDLESYIKLNRCVMSVKKDDEKWHVEYINLLNNEKRTEKFDFVIVATNMDSKPRIPKIENMENFKGIVMHSSEFKVKDERLKAKNVVVVGHCCSGPEIASNLVGHAKSIINVFERPHLIVERMIRIKCLDNPNLYQILPFDLFFKKRKNFYKDPSTPLSGEALNETLNELFRTACPQQISNDIHPDLYFDLKAEPDKKFGIADNYLPYVNLGKITPKRGKIVRFEGDGILLEDGSLLKADAVIFGTGYLCNFDFLDKTILKEIDFDPGNYLYQFLTYNFTFHPSYESLGFVHCVRGVFLAEVEIQAEWIIRVFSKKVSFPDKQLMLKEIKTENETKRHLNLQFANGLLLAVSDKMALDSQQMPDFKKIAETDPDLFYKLWNYPTDNSIYHFDTNRELVQESVEKFQKLEEKRYEFDDKEKYPTAYELASKMSKYFNINLERFKLKE